MLYLLDADILNYLLKASVPVTQRFRMAVLDGDEFLLCPVVHFQVTRYLKLKGAVRLLRFYDQLTTEWPVAPLSLIDWAAAADLWAQRHREGKPIEDGDLLIAISARQAGAVLVTNNTRHFDGLGIPMVNWAQAT